MNFIPQWNWFLTIRTYTCPPHTHTQREQASSQTPGTPGTHLPLLQRCFLHLSLCVPGSPHAYIILPSLSLIFPLTDSLPILWPRQQNIQLPTLSELYILRLRHLKKKKRELLLESSCKIHDWSILSCVLDFHSLTRKILSSSCCHCARPWDPSENEIHKVSAPVSLTVNLVRR